MFMEEQEYDGQDDGEFMEMYSIDDTLSPIEKLERYHTSDFSLQRLILARELYDIAVDTGFQGAQARMLPLLPAFVSDPEPAVRQQFVEKLPALSEFWIEKGGELGSEDFIHTLLPFTFELLVDKNVEVGSSAIVALSKISKFVSADKVENHLLSVVVTLAHDDRAEDYRVVAAQLFDELSPTFELKLSESVSCPELSTLRKDASFVVRRTVGANLGKIGAVLGPELFTEKLLPLWVELGKDDVWGVRKACAESICLVSSAATPQARKTIVFEAFLRFANDVSRWVRVAASQKLGELIATCDKDEISDEILRQYTTMATQRDPSGDNDSAEYCAYTFPAVVKTVGPERWKDLSPAFQLLVKDNQWKVRRMIAHSLHETAQMLGREISEKHLADAFEAFLKDMDDVRIGLVQHVDEFLAVLGEKERERFVPQLCKLPTESESWRLRNLIAEKIGMVAEIVSPALCRQSITELVTKILEDSVASVRKSCAGSAARLVLRLAADDEKDRTFLDHCKGLVTKPGFQARQSFAIVAQEVALRERDQKDGAALFEKEFLPGLLTLAKDKVPNVRLAVSQALLKAVVGTKWEPQVTAIRGELKNDTDSDVQYFASLDKFPDPIVLEEA